MYEKLINDIPIPEISSETKTHILSLKAFELVKFIKNNTFTVEEVLYTYIERAQTLGRANNLTAEELFTDALARASSLSDSSEKILYGIPISVKDMIYQEDCCSSGGLAWKCFTKDPGDSILISLLRSAGCLPFVRSNLMQLMMWMETSNDIYGRANNPWDITRTTGGSSGGDGGLVAIGGALIGIGSDIGGSIRFPSAFCGVYGFKPSSRRISVHETMRTHPTCMAPLELVVNNAFGPIGRCVEDLALVLQAWWQEGLWIRDNVVVPLKFNFKEFEDARKLRIGYFSSNPVFESADVIKNIVLNTADKLREDGHELIEVSTELIVEALKLYMKAFFGIEGKYLLEELQGEDPSWAYFLTYVETKYPIYGYMVKKLLKLSGFHTACELFSLSRPLSYKDLCVVGGEISDLKMTFNAYYQSLGLDAIICPI